MKKDPLIFIGHILDSIKNIEEFIKDTSKEEFFKDKLRQNAVVREIEIIGEAVKNISDSLKNKYPNIPWRDIAGMRDKIIHHYFGLDLEEIWQVIKKDINTLKQNLSEILKSGKT